MRAICFREPEDVEVIELDARRSTVISYNNPFKPVR